VYNHTVNLSSNEFSWQLQYILGTQPFASLELRVRPPTLIPRPETEEWTSRLSHLLRPSPDTRIGTRVLDLCTGTGCIPLLLAHSWPPGTVTAVGVDVSQEAVSLARENAKDYSLQASAEASQVTKPRNTVEFVHADIMSMSFAKQLKHNPLFRPGFDLITSNPPYIPLHEYDALDPSVKNFEDPRALLGDPFDLPTHLREPSQTLPEDVVTQDHKGLTFYRALARLAALPGVLRPGAPLVMEVGAGQAADVEHILRQTLVNSPSPREDGAGFGRRIPAFAKTERWLDAWNIQRVVVGWRSQSDA
jgi:release factor glutamine methyltransferase